MKIENTQTTSNHGKDKKNYYTYRHSHFERKNNGIRAAAQEENITFEQALQKANEQRVLIDALRGKQTW